MAENNNEVTALLEINENVRSNQNQGNLVAVQTHNEEGIRRRNEELRRQNEEVRHRQNGEIRRAPRPENAARPQQNNEHRGPPDYFYEFFHRNTVVCLLYRIIFTVLFVPVFLFLFPFTLPYSFYQMMTAERLVIPRDPNDNEETDNENPVNEIIQQQPN